MEAFLFVVTIPTADYEKHLTETLQKSTNVSIHNECGTSKNLFKFSDKVPSKDVATSSNDVNNDGVSEIDDNIKNSDINISKIHQEQNVGVVNVVGDLQEGEVKRRNVSSIKKSQTKTSLKSHVEDNRLEASSSTPRVKKFKQEEDEIIQYDGELPLEKIVEQTLANLNISAISWTSSTEKNHFHISFGVQGGVHCERVLHELRECGVGSRVDSTLSVLPCALHYSAPTDKDPRIGKAREIKDSAWSTFVRSVRSRLTVAQVLEQVKTGAALTFDFFFLLIVAALTAALGLAENSTVFLVASMLISPLMGPIMAGTFGTAIQDRNLQKIGVIHELVGVFVTMAVGFVFGMIICGINEKYGTGEWPTSEIMSRCDVRSLWVGALVALPSGAAVAISVLGGNTTSLVGVAISASLLPPAVNAGLLWAMSLVHLIFLNDDTKFINVVKTKDYSDNPAIELAINGFISLLLTIINIVCIYVGGILVLMIKKVSPINSSNESEWQKDIKAARDFNKNLNEGQNENHLRDGEILESHRSSDLETVLEQAFAWEALRVTQRDIVEQLKLQTCKHMTWSPAATNNKRPMVQDLYGAYRRLSEVHPVKKSKPTAPTNQSQNYSRLQEESPATSEIFNSQSDVRKSKRKSKFIITPVVDSVYNNTRRNSAVE